MKVERIYPYFKRVTTPLKSKFNRPKEHVTNMINSLKLVVWFDVTYLLFQYRDVRAEPEKQKKFNIILSRLRKAIVDQMSKELLSYEQNEVTKIVII